MAICIVSLLWYEQKFQFLVKVKATGTDTLLDGIPRNDAVVEMCSGEFSGFPVVIRSENYQHHHHHHMFFLTIFIFKLTNDIAALRGLICCLCSHISN
jgi:hypothetical protein